MLYAGALLAIGLFSERAYCRFLCPLGGVLAFLDRLHLLNLLKRRPECGSPCHLCERACPVRAIEPTGKIVTAECFQCLDCQVEYYDEKRCPPLVWAAKLRGEVKADRRQGEQCLKRHSQLEQARPIVPAWKDVRHAVVSCASLRRLPACR